MPYFPPSFLCSSRSLPQSLRQPLHILVRTRLQQWWASRKARKQFAQLAKKRADAGKQLESQKEVLQLGLKAIDQERKQWTVCLCPTSSAGADARQHPRTLLDGAGKGHICCSSCPACGGLVHLRDVSLLRGFSQPLSGGRLSSITVGNGELPAAPSSTNLSMSDLRFTRKTSSLPTNRWANLGGCNRP